MSDETKRPSDEAMDDVSGGTTTHPVPRDPVRPPSPPTHPGGPGGVLDPIGPTRPTHPG